VTLPNDTYIIRVTNTKTGIISVVEGAFAGKEILTTAEDGSQTTTATVYN
jgi:hypothetical protein